jgi:hypothetical protein
MPDQKFSRRQVVATASALSIGGAHAGVPLSGCVFEQTPAETAAAVSPTNRSFPPGTLERYYSGSGDARRALQAAVSCNARVCAFHGTKTAYDISDHILIPAGVILENIALRATADVKAYAEWGANHQGQLLLLNGDGAKVRNVRIDGANFNSGGIGMNGFAGNEVVDCEISRTGKCAGILLISPGTTSFRVAGNLIYRATQGIQHWQVTHGTISDNVVRVVAGGGIWGADSVNVQISGNAISDCGDVGLDCEGGVDCSHVGNTVRSCNNGEIAWFANGTGSGRVPVNCHFSGNTAHHLPTYLAWDGRSEVARPANASWGSLIVASVTDGQRGIVFSNNNVRSDAGAALYTNDFGAVSCGIEIHGNSFASSVQTHKVQRACGIVVCRNSFRALAGAERNHGVFDNCSGAIWLDNLYVYERPPTTTYALAYAADARVEVGPTIAGNTFKNTGSRAFLHHAARPGAGALVYNNRFSDDFIGNAGVATKDGSPIFRGQRLLLGFTGSLDLAAVAALGGPHTVGYGTLVVMSGGSIAAGLALRYGPTGPTLTSHDGAGGGPGGVRDAHSYAEFSGTTIRLNGAGALTGRIEIDVTSWTSTGGEA